MPVTYENNNLTVIGPNWSNPRIIDLTEDEAREVVRVLSSQLTPVAGDGVTTCPTCGAPTDKDFNYAPRA